MPYSPDIDLATLQNIPCPSKRQWKFFSEIDSTNAEISRCLPKHPSEEGLVVLADSQTGGKGRKGRVWHSEPGVGIYISTLIRPDLTPRQLPILTLMAGLATALAVNDFITQPAKLKWPNDLLLSGKKVAGILCEYQPVEIPAVIIGIGINVNQNQFPEDIKSIATSLKLESGIKINRTELIKSLITQLDNQYRELTEGKVQALIENWTQHTDLFGKTISLNKGNQSISGKASRLDEEGRLVLINASGEEHAYDSGEVSIIKKK